MFTVVVAAYEAAGFIAPGVASALDQTWPPAEVVVCDDGSTDDLATALGPFGGRVRLLRREHGGEAAAKNAAIQSATTEWIVVLDADDLFLPSRLEAMADLCDGRPDLDIVTTDAWLDFDGIRARRSYDETNPFPVDDQSVAILDRNFIFGLVAVRRDRVVGAGGFDPAIPVAADWDLWLRMIRAGSRVGLVDEPLAVYRIRPDSMTGRASRALAGRIDVLSRAAVRTDLSPDEKVVVRSALAREQRAHALAAAREAVIDGAAGARRKALSVVVGRGHRPLSRLKSTLAVVSPRLAARWLRDGQPRDEHRTGTARTAQGPVPP